MKRILLPFLLPGLLFLSGCASVPLRRSVPMPPVIEVRENAVPEPEPPVEALEIPELPDGVRIFHEDQEISMEMLARGTLAEGSLIQIGVTPSVTHSVVSGVLIDIHKMGYLVGIRMEKEAP